MKKIVKILYLVGLGFIGNANAALVEDAQGNKIDFENIDVYLMLEDAPAKQRMSLLQNKKQIKEQLKNLYILKTVAKQAKQDVSLTTATNKEKVQQIIDRFYFGLLFNKQMAEGLPNFEGLAKVEYRVNKEFYKKPEQIDVSHIMLRTGGNEKKTLLKMHEIQEKLASGQDMSQLAIEYSDDPSVKKNKGHLGVLAKGQLVKEFEEVAYALKEGEISQPVKTQFGYHLIKLNKYYPARALSFDEVKEQIEEKIKSDYIKDKKEAFLSEIVKKNKMQFNEKEIDAYIAEKLKQYVSKTK